VIVVSCRSNEKKKIQKTAIATASSSHITNPVMDDFAVNAPHLEEFKTFLKGLNDTVTDNATVAAKKFQELFKNDDATICDTALILFNKFDVLLADKADGVHDKDTTIQYDSLLTDSNGIHSNQISAKTAQYDRLLKANGLRVTSEEGETYIVQDLDFEIKWFKDKLSKPIQQYLTETAKEDKEGLAEDMGLVITPKKLAERTIWWEDYLKKYPNIIVSVQTKYNWQGDLEILLTGLDNSPVLNHSPFSLDDRYAEAYTFLQISHPNSNTNQIINPYFKLTIKKDSTGAKKLLENYEKQGIIAKPGEEGD
jgi:hypothetical protein